MTDTRSALQIRRDVLARPKGVMPHICETPDCPYTGKPSPDSCACHLTEIACLRAVNAELVAALEKAASEIEELHRRAAQKDWAGYSSAHGVCVVYKARAVLAKAKEEMP